ncbi:hypothetical protein MHBO_002749 [Bonamia ostreae]|uniref:Uncharacterized protein n=1 Tax=Bonamia ostreae TaxID=126728 RepID=A0ABV2AND7_9EUKA
MTRRVSLRLLSELHRRSKSGLHGISEVSVNTTCHTMLNGKVEIIDKKFLGSTLSQTGRVSKKQWRELMVSQPNRLFHAMKW